MTGRHAPICRSVPQERMIAAYFHPRFRISRLRGRRAGIRLQMTDTVTAMHSQPSAAVIKNNIRRKLVSEQSFGCNWKTSDSGKINTPWCLV